MGLKPNQSAFKDEIERRGITRLIHFTPAINLISIYEQGALVSREQLKQLDAKYPDLHLKDFVEFNDRIRLDGREGYLNLSIEHPNYPLFRRFRDSCRNWCDSWCVIAIRTECIWLNDTLFSIGNAAANSSKRHGIDGEFETFYSLFNDQVVSENMYSRRTLNRRGLKDCYPTDPQAEVLVKGEITVDEIMEIHFADEEEARRSRGAIQLLVDDILPPFSVNTNLFKDRVCNG